jgi:ribosomal protein S18 acetylase RimI-like enzyme
MADWDIRGGKMVEGRGRMVESRVFHVAVKPDWHPSWQEALAFEETAVRVEIHKGEAIIPESHVAAPFRSTGLGQKLYMRAIDDMLADGLIVNSDVNVSENAIAMWKSLRKQGYDVVQRVPDSRLERGEDGMYSHAGEPVSVFFIARKKPDMPDLPVAKRDVMNALDEQRALTEHLPACLGKRRA